MKSGSMKPDAAKATKIVFANVAVMTTLCAPAVALCNKLLQKHLWPQEMLTTVLTCYPFQMMVV